MNSKNISNEGKMENKKSKVDFENLKSNFIIKKIFNYMRKNKPFKIMKYNKKLQKRLNLSINDYKECNQLYTNIEIELKFVNNKYGNFINIPKNDKKYYHIYFDNSNEEINRDYLNENDKVKTINIIIDYQVLSLKKLFYKCKFIYSIFFKKFFRINISDMSYMFYECSSLRELNLSNLNTNNVTNMSCMFSKCSLLQKLNLSNFNTNNVTDMSYMFCDCWSLRKLNISSFNTNNVTHMSQMFFGCSALDEINYSNFNTDNVISMGGMFYDCDNNLELKKKLKLQYKSINI